MNDTLFNIALSEGIFHAGQRDLFRRFHDSYHAHLKASNKRSPDPETVRAAVLYGRLRLKMSPRDMQALEALAMPPGSQHISLTRQRMQDVKGRLRNAMEALLEGMPLDELPANAVLSRGK